MTLRGSAVAALAWCLGWEYVLPSVLWYVSDHSLCLGEPGRWADQSHSSDGVQKLRGPRKHVGARDGIWVVAPGRTLHLIALEILGSLSRERGRPRLPGPGGSTLQMQLPALLARVDFLGGGGKFLDKVVPVRRSRGDVVRTPRTGLLEGRKDRRSKPGA